MHLQVKSQLPSSTLTRLTSSLYDIFDSYGGDGPPNSDGDEDADGGICICGIHSSIAVPNV